MISKFLTYIAFLTLLLNTAGDVHERICLDGQRAPVSVHFENLDGHSDSRGDDVLFHQDYEVKYSANAVQVKFAKFDQNILTASNSFFFSPPRYILRFSPDTKDRLIFGDLATVLPPLRAPPLSS